MRREDPADSGVTAQENKGLIAGKREVIGGEGDQPPTGIIRKTRTKGREGKEAVKRYKGPYQDEDASGGRHLRGSLAVISGEVWPTLCSYELCGTHCLCLQRLKTMETLPRS